MFARVALLGCSVTLMQQWTRDRGIVAPGRLKVASGPGRHSGLLVKQPSASDRLVAAAVWQSDA